MSMLGRIVLAAALFCGAPAAAQQAAAPAATAADVKTETGVIDGATYRIDVPAKWNGGLIVQNHGYSPEPRLPAGGPPSARLRVFLDRGFAVAQSSYSKGGWAVEQALSDNEKLIKHFKAKNGGKASPVIATGGAMGASVTTASVEMQPQLYDAGLVTSCSGLDPRLENMNWNFEMLALFDYYFPNIMPPLVGPLNGFPYQSQENRAKIQAALDANPEKAEIFRRLWGRKKEEAAQRLHIRQRDSEAAAGRQHAVESPERALHFTVVAQVLKHMRAVILRSLGSVASARKSSCQALRWLASSVSIGWSSAHMTMPATAAMLARLTPVIAQRRTSNDGSPTRHVRRSFCLRRFFGRLSMSSPGWSRAPASTAPRNRCRRRVRPSARGRDRSCPARC